MKAPVCVLWKTIAIPVIVITIVTIVVLWLLPFTRLAYGQTFGSALSASATTASPADWSQFHRDNMQRWNPYETVLGVNNVAGLQLKWKNSLSVQPNSDSSPAVANGVVYFGSEDGNVYALNANNGAQLWSYQTGNTVASSPAVANGMVYVGSLNGNLYALSASTGAKLWSYATGSGVYSSPAVVNGVVYFGSEDQNVYALNASTGAKLWSFATGDLVFSSPAVANGLVYVGSYDSNVYALNATTGAKLWSYKTGTLVHSSPAVANGVVYFRSDALYAVNASTGAKLWSYPTQVGENSSPAVANGIVYFSGGDGNVYALNASTGAKLWTYATGAFRLPSSPAVANGVVYVAPFNFDRGGNVYALNATTGARLWSYASGDSASSPAIVDGVVYLRARNTAMNDVTYAFALGSADLFLRIFPSTMTVHQGDLLTYAFPVWNMGADNSVQEVLNTQIPAGTVFEYIRISGTPGLGTCNRPPYHGTGKIVCHENDSMAPNTTWTVRLTVKVTAPAGTEITANAATMSDTPDPNLANNTATVSLTVQ